MLDNDSPSEEGVTTAFVEPARASVLCEGLGPGVLLGTTSLSRPDDKLFLMGLFSGEGGNDTVLQALQAGRRKSP